MLKQPLRINLWSGPRNISTALMYSFAQRNDTIIFDEPLYAHYLSNTPAKTYHPGADEVLQSQENDGNNVVKMMMGEHSTSVVFFKQMTHHLVELDWNFILNCVNIILTRDPHDMLLSFINQIENPQLVDTGYAAHHELLSFLKKHESLPIVLDGKNVLLNPEKVLKTLCERLEIPFQKSMLSWKAGARKEDGVWAKHWYQNVHKSEGFTEYKPKNASLPKRLQPLYKECMPYYNELKKLAIQP